MQKFEYPEIEVVILQVADNLASDELSSLVGDDGTPIIPID